MANKNCSCTEFRKITRASGIPIKITIRFCYKDGLARVWCQLTSPGYPTAETTAEHKAPDDWMLFESLVAGCMLVCIQEAIEADGYGFAIEHLRKGIESLLEHAHLQAEVLSERGGSSGRSSPSDEREPPHRPVDCSEFE